MRADRENLEQSRGSELSSRDRDANRKSDMISRGLRGDEFGDHDHRQHEGAGTVDIVRARFPFADKNLDFDRGGDRTLFRERLGGEDDHFRGPRTTRFGPRDEGWRGSDREPESVSVYGNRDEGWPSARAHHDFSDRDEYFGRRASDPYMDRDGDYMQEQEEGLAEERYQSGVGDSYTDQARDSRYGSFGADPYRDDRNAGHGPDRSVLDFILYVMVLISLRHSLHLKNLCYLFILCVSSPFIYLWLI